MFYFCFFRTLHHFSLQLCSFCWRELKNISCLRVQSSLATPLDIVLNTVSMTNLLTQRLTSCAFKGLNFKSLTGIGAGRRGAGNFSPALDPLCPPRHLDLITNV